MIVNIKAMPLEEIQNFYAELWQVMSSALEGIEQDKIVLACQIAISKCPGCDEINWKCSCQDNWIDWD